MPKGAIVHLISLFGKNDFRAFFPSSLHLHGQDLVFDAGCVSILVHNLLNTPRLGDRSEGLS